MSDMNSESESVESADSDKELQAAFATGLMKFGLNVEVTAPKQCVNLVTSLNAARVELSKDKELPWVERLDLTTDLAPTLMAVEDLEEASAENGDDVHDDFKREMRFYRQAQQALLHAIPRLKALCIPTRRSDDYFAEMAKSDEHMKKVREKLLSKQLSIERSEKAKQMRELRKYGKQVQKDVLSKRRKEKKEMLDQVKKARKGKLTNLDFLEDGDHKEKKQKEKAPGKSFLPNKKRQSRNLKFGFGGQKKRSKYNTSNSASDMSGFSAKTHGSKGGKTPVGLKATGKRPRMGKKKRQIAKNRKR